MATTVQTVTLSPAFLQEIKEDDDRLHKLVERFGHLVESEHSGASTDRQLAGAAARLRDQLAFHFALEEAYGYFEDPVAVAPRLSERVECLRAEHRELYESIARIADRAERRAGDHGRGPVAENIRRMCRDFLDWFASHESKENALISQAFNEDIGVGD